MKSTRIPITKGMRFEVLRRDNFRCHYCGEESKNTKLQVGHIVPVSMGGSSDISNLVAACHDCNSGKGAKPIDEKHTAQDAKKHLKAQAKKIKEMKRVVDAINLKRQAESSEFEIFATSWVKAFGDCGYTVNRNYIDSQRVKVKTKVKAYGIEICCETLASVIEQSINSYGESTDQSLCFGYWMKVVQYGNSNVRMRMSYLTAIFKNRCPEFEDEDEKRDIYQFVQSKISEGIDIEEIISIAKGINSLSDLKEMMGVSQK